MRNVTRRGLVATSTISIGLGACAANQTVDTRLENTSLPAAQTVDSAQCSLGSSSRVIKQEGNANLEAWTVPNVDVFTSSVLPTDTAFLDFRRTIELAQADVNPPVADPPQPANDDERRIWMLEAQNVDVAYSGRAGRMRPVQCLDALLFARQNRRYSQISHPTEFIASILRRTIDGQNMFKIYLAGSDMLFPSQSFYGLDEITNDLAAGWEWWTVLHNHTIRSNNGAPALGVPAPSTSDVDLLRSLANSNGLQNAWVTNGFFTIEIPASAFVDYVGRR